MFKLRRIPLWYLRLKLGVTFAALISLSAMGFLIYNEEGKLKVQKDPLRKESLPTDQEILSGTVGQ